MLCILFDMKKEKKKVANLRAGRVFKILDLMSFVLLLRITFPACYLKGLKDYTVGIMHFFSV